MALRKKHIYFMPGLGASSRIFENLELDSKKSVFII